MGPDSGAPFEGAARTRALPGQNAPCTGAASTIHNQWSYTGQTHHHEPLKRDAAKRGKFLQLVKPGECRGRPLSPRDCTQVAFWRRQRNDDFARRIAWTADR